MVTLSSFSRQTALPANVSADAWFAVRVRSNFEQMTSEALRARGVEEFLPLVHVRRRWSDRVKELDVPLFPGYVFCRIDSSRRVPVLSCPGVVNIISFDSRPAPIPDEEIQAVRVLVQSNLGLEPHPYLASGETVRIEQGALAGVEGIVVEVKKRFRLVVSVNLLQRSISVEVDRAWVSSVPHFETGAPAHSRPAASKGYCRP